MKNTILIADDSELNRKILRTLFEGKYIVLEAANGREALVTVENCSDRIDLVLLDADMPEMNGMDVLRERQKMEAFGRIPVIIITSGEGMEEQAQAFALGASDFIDKPFMPEVVTSRVDNIMATQKRFNQIEQEAGHTKAKAEADEMTGLYNKAAAERIIGETLREFPQERCALLVIDIDNFQLVNESQGHQTGNRTLRIVANTISSLFRKSDIVGRVGEDEFVVCMVNIPSMEIVRQKVNDLVMMMKYRPNLTIPENVSLSIGYTQTNESRSTYEELFRCADAALQQAKANGKAQAREYGAPLTKARDDFRRAVLLLGRNRSVCSAVQMMCPKELRIVEALDTECLDKLDPADIADIMLAYVDISDMEENTLAFWEALRCCDWLQRVPIIVICEEGNLRQYREALSSDMVADVLTSPLEKSIFERRTARLLRGEQS